MIEGIFELADQNVADIMTPRSQINSCPLDLPLDDVLRYAMRCGHTRIPVYQDNFDKVCGILFVKDLLGELSPDNAQRRKSLRTVTTDRS